MATKYFIKAAAGLMIGASAFYGASIASASAAPHYRAYYYYPPDDDAYYAAPPPVGFVFMRHSPRCDYPHGWSVTDFTRNVNGVPRDGNDLLATGCGAYDPLSD